MLPCWGAKMCYIVICFNVVLSIFCIHCIVHMYICKCMVPWWKGKSRCIHLSAHIVPSDQTSWDLFLTNICDWIRRICKSDILISALFFVIFKLWLRDIPLNISLHGPLLQPPNFVALQCIDTGAFWIQGYRTEVEFVTAVTAGGSVKFLPAA